MQVTFHGVDKSGDNWSSHVQVGPVRVFAGSYPTAAQAALAYNAVLEALITAGALAGIPFWQCLSACIFSP